MHFRICASEGILRRSRQTLRNTKQKKESKARRNDWLEQTTRKKYEEEVEAKNLVKSWDKSKKEVDVRKVADKKLKKYRIEERTVPGKRKSFERIRLLESLKKRKKKK